MLGANWEVFKVGGQHLVNHAQIFEIVVDCEYSSKDQGLCKSFI